MILESIINFEVGQRVVLNPDNHGYHKKRTGCYLKVKNRLGTIKKIEEIGNVDKKSGQFSYGRTGRITLEWDNDFVTKIYKYRNLKIV